MKVIFIIITMIILTLSFLTPVPTTDSDREHERSEHHRHGRHEVSGNDRPAEDRRKHEHSRDEERNDRHESASQRSRDDRNESSRDRRTDHRHETSKHRSEDHRHKEPRHETDKTICHPPEWKSLKGFASRQRLMLSVFGSSDGEERCTRKCLRYSSCATVDTLVKGRETSCFATTGLADLEYVKDYVHWDYELQCRTANGTVHVFQYIGNYTVRPQGNHTKYSAASLQQCVKLCAVSATCRVFFYSDSRCYHVTSLGEARRDMMIQHDASAFWKKIHHRKRYANNANHTQVKADYCNSQGADKRGNGTSRGSLICWSKKANHRCTFHYVGEYRLTNRTLVTQLSTLNLTACLLKCTEAAQCGAVSYHNKVCQMVERRRAEMPAKAETRNSALYLKKNCPTATAATYTALSAARVVLLAFSVHFVF